MLRKMLLEYIVRPEEVKEFAAGLEDHQRATVEGGSTVLERAVREHNVGACAKVSPHTLSFLELILKVYDNISFEALGAILNVDADAAQLIARKMIEQGR
jgi:COP9 signalosome complex subunit 4